MDNKNYTVLQSTGIRTQTLYVTNKTRLTPFLRDLLHGTITDYSIEGFFSEISDYLVSLTFFPFNLGKFYDTTHPSYVSNANILLGKVSLSSIDYPGFNVPYRWTSTLLFSTTITRTHNNFLDYAPYTKISIFIPFFDLIEIPTDRAYKGTLYCEWGVDAWTGKVSCELYNDSGVIYYGTKQLGIPIPLGRTNAQEQERNMVMGMISSIGSIIGIGIGVSHGNPLITAGSLGIATKSVNSAIQNSVYRISGYSGGNGDRSGLYVNKSVRLIVETVQNVKTPDYSLVGKPLNENKTLSSISGFTQISDINFNPSGYEITDDEISEIIDLLKSGVIL